MRLISYLNILISYFIMSYQTCCMSYQTNRVRPLDYYNKGGYQGEITVPQQTAGERIIGWYTEYYIWQTGLYNIFR